MDWKGIGLKGRAFFAKNLTFRQAPAPQYQNQKMRLIHYKKKARVLPRLRCCVYKGVLGDYFKSIASSSDMSALAAV